MKVFFCEYAESCLNKNGFRNSVFFYAYKNEFQSEK